MFWLPPARRYPVGRAKRIGELAIKRKAAKLFAWLMFAIIFLLGALVSSAIWLVIYLYTGILTP